jgi:hypothetical protein
MQVVAMTTATTMPVPTIEPGKRPVREASSIRASFTPSADGGGQLTLSYAGPLTAYDPIWVRLGERRRGKDWVQTRDLRMGKAADGSELHVEVEPGEPLEAFTFAFFTKGNGSSQEVWDNAGKPFGCYVLDAKTGRIGSR